MYQKDYILRMVEMLSELIAGILGLIKKGELQRATQAIENAYYDFLKKDAAFFRQIEKEKLTDLLISEHNYTNGHLEILSELFFAEAELHFTKGNHLESLEYYEKSLHLNVFVEKNSKSYSIDKQSRTSFIQEQITHIKSEIK